MNRWLLLLAVGCAPETLEAEDRSAVPPTNVLLVLLDDVGVERLGIYGLRDDSPVTPTIDGLAADGVRFRHAWSTPLCSPSRAALLTGRYPGRTGIGALVDPWRDEFDLDPAEITIPEMLAHAADAWDSSVVGKWHVASQSGGDPALDPLEQGFGWSGGSLGNLRDPFDGHSGADLSYFDWMKAENGEMRRVDRYATTELAHDATDRIGAMTEPWLLYLPMNAAHEPYHVPPADLYTTPLPADPTPAERYDRMIESADTELGRILAEMDPDVLARTTIVVVGDNGTPEEVLREPFVPSASKGSVYEIGVNVPLVIAGPYVEAPGQESDALVHLVDLFATVADLAHVDLTELGVPVDGRSLLPALRDPDAPVHDVLFTETFEPNGPGPRTSFQRAVRDDRYKLVHHWTADQESEELYDLQGAVLEGPDLDADPAMADELRQLREQLDRVASER